MDWRAQALLAARDGSTALTRPLSFSSTRMGEFAVWALAGASATSAPRPPRKAAASSDCFVEARVMGVSLMGSSVSLTLWRGGPLQEACTALATGPPAQPLITPAL